MGIFGDSTLRALAAGGQGAGIAAQTLLEQLRAQAAKQAMTQEQQQQQAQQMRTRIMMSLMQAAGQTPQLQPPIPPQPGAPSVPGGAPGGAPNPGQPGMGTPGGNPALALLQGGGGGAPPASNPALAVLQGQQPQAPQGQGGPQMPQAGGVAGMPRLTWQTIMQEIKKQAPNISPQQLTAVIDQFMPIMDAQSQQDWDQKKFAFQQFKDQERYELDTRKIDETVRRDDLKAQHDQALEDHAARMEAISQMHFNSSEMRQAAREQENERHNRVEEQLSADLHQIDRDKLDFQRAKQGAGDKKAQADLGLVNMSINDIDQLIAQVTKNPGVVGGVGMISGALSGIRGQIESAVTGKPSTEDTGRADFTSKREALGARLRVWLQQRASTLGSQGQSLAALLPGLGPTSSSGQVLSTLKQIRNELDTYKQLNPATAAIEQAPIGGASSSAPSRIPKGTYKSVADIAAAIRAGKITRDQGLAYSDENPDLP